MTLTVRGLFVERENKILTNLAFKCLGEICAEHKINFTVKFACEKDKSFPYMINYVFFLSSL